MEESKVLRQAHTRGLLATGWALALLVVPWHGTVRAQIPSATSAQARSQDPAQVPAQVQAQVQAQDPAQAPAQTQTQVTAQTPAPEPAPPGVVSDAKPPLPAVESPSAPPSAPSAPSAPAVLAAARRNAQAGAEWLARGVDSWFGNKPFEDGGAVTHGRLSLVAFKRQDQKMDVDLRFSARYRLPNVEQQAYLFIGRDDAREVQRDTPDGLSDPLRLQTGGGRTQRTLLAGLGLTLQDRLDFRVGLGRRLKPYAQARYVVPWELAAGHALDFRQTLFWTREDRVGLTTALSLDATLSRTLALRWLNASTTTQQAQATQWSSSLGLYAQVSGRHQLSVEALFSGTSQRGPGVIVSDRGLLAKWEQPLHQSWLLGELMVGHFWPLRDAAGPRQQAWAVGAALKMKL